MKDEKLNLKDIAKYVYSNYKDSCFSSNHELEDIDKYDDEYLLNEMQGFFIYELLGIYGCCGDPDLAINVVTDYLSILKETSGTSSSIKKRLSLFKEKFGYKTIYENGMFIFLAYMLDNKGLTEHGSGIGWCWLTELGEMCLYVLSYDNKEEDNK